MCIYIMIRSFYTSITLLFFFKFFLSFFSHFKHTTHYSHLLENDVITSKIESLHIFASYDPPKFHSYFVFTSYKHGHYCSEHFVFVFVFFNLISPTPSPSCSGFPFTRAPSFEGGGVFVGRDTWRIQASVKQKLGQRMVNQRGRVRWVVVVGEGVGGGQVEILRHRAAHMDREAWCDCGRNRCQLFLIGCRVRKVVEGGGGGGGGAHRAALNRPDQEVAVNTIKL